MQISSNYDSLTNRIWQLYGSTSGSANQVSTAGSSSSGSSDQVDLSDDYLSFQSFLDKIKNGTVTDDDLSEMQEEMYASQQMQMPAPPPMQMSGSGNGEEDIAIGSFLDKVKSGTVTTDDLTNMESVLSTTDDNSADTVSSTDGQITFQSFMDKVKDGTVTDDDLTQMKSLLEQMDQNGGVHHRRHMEQTAGTTGIGDDDSVSSADSGTVSSAGSSTNSLTLESFLDKVKNGTVTDDDLTQMQSELNAMDQNASGRVGLMHMPPPMMTDTGDSSTDSDDSSDSLDNLTLESFLDKVQSGTVTDDDLTAMQSLLQNWFDSGTSDSSGTYAQTYTL